MKQEECKERVRVLRGSRGFEMEGFQRLKFINLSLTGFVKALVVFRAANLMV